MQKKHKKKLRLTVDQANTASSSWPTLHISGWLQAAGRWISSPAEMIPSMPRTCRTSGWTPSMAWKNKQINANTFTGVSKPPFQLQISFHYTVKCKSVFSQLYSRCLHQAPERQQRRLGLHTRCLELALNGGSTLQVFTCTKCRNAEMPTRKGIHSAIDNATNCAQPPPNSGLS